MMAEQYSDELVWKAVSCFSVQQMVDGCSNGQYDLLKHIPVSVLEAYVAEYYTSFVEERKRRIIEQF